MKKINKYELTEQELEEVIEAIIHKTFSSVKDNIGSNFNFDWISERQASKILGISTRQLYNYRIRRRIKYSQCGRKIFYKKTDINNFLMETYVKH